MEQPWESFLRHEFDAEPGSFLIRLRVDLEWDTEAFERLTAAMEACCRATASANRLDRWLADGFWYLDTFTRLWTNHSSWQRRPDVTEIENGCQRLSDLAYWFFTGQSPFESDAPPQGS